MVFSSYGGFCLVALETVVLPDSGFCLINGFRLVFQSSGFRRRRRFLLRIFNRWFRVVGFLNSGIGSWISD